MGLRDTVDTLSKKLKGLRLEELPVILSTDNISDTTRSGPQRPPKQRMVHFESNQYPKSKAEEDKEDMRLLEEFKARQQEKEEIRRKQAIETQYRKQVKELEHATRPKLETTTWRDQLRHNIQLHEAMRL